MKNKIRIICVMIMVVALGFFGRTVITNAAPDDTVDEAFFFVTTGYSERELANVTVYGRAYAIEEKDSQKVVIKAEVHGLQNASSTDKKEGKIFVTSPGWNITEASLRALKSTRQLEIYHCYEDPPEGIIGRSSPKDVAKFETVILARGSYTLSITVEPKDPENPPDRCTIVVLLSSSRIYRSHASNDYYCIIESDHVTVQF